MLVYKPEGQNIVSALTRYAREIKGPASTPTKFDRKSCEGGSTEPATSIATPNVSGKPSIPARFAGHRGEKHVEPEDSEAKARAWGR